MRCTGFSGLPSVENSPKKTTTKFLYDNVHTRRLMIMKPKEKFKVLKTTCFSREINYLFCQCGS